MDKLTYDRAELAEVLGVSSRALSAWQDAGRIPQPLRLGRRRVWLRETIREWLAAGAPSCRPAAAGPRSKWARS
jgi:predicted DNA-binding transcriptional regulator AlpA